MPDLRQELERIEHAIRKLKIAYELYFCGTEKLPPIKQREELDRLVRKYSGMNFPNTGDRFYFNTVQNRYHSYAELWNKQMRMREEGRVTVGRRVDTSGVARPLQSTPSLARTVTAPAAGKRRVSRPSREGAVRLSPDRLEDASLRSLYNSFTQARAQVGQAGKTPGYERFRDQIQSQLQALKKQGKTGPVEFKVSIQDRKVSLKARPSR